MKIIQLLLSLLLFCSPAWSSLPTIDSATAGTDSVSDTSQVATLPTITSGDVVVCLIHGSTGAETWPNSGPDNIWTEFLGHTASGAGRFTAGWHEGTGSEAATVTVTTTNSVPSAWRCWALSGATDPDTAPPETAASVAEGSSTTPDPASLTPSGFGGCNDTYWLAFAGVTGGSSPFDGWPSSYVNTGQQDAGSPALAYADRANAGASEDPGTFSISGTDSWGASVIAVPGICAGASAAVQRRRFE